MSFIHSTHRQGGPGLSWETWALIRHHGLCGGLLWGSGVRQDAERWLLPPSSSKVKEDMEGSERLSHLRKLTQPWCQGASPLLPG